MAGNEVARNRGGLEAQSGKIEQAVKNWTIAASAECYESMHVLISWFELGYVRRESMDSVLAAYNNSCAQMRSKARDAYIHNLTE
jgi:hypothetical protein